MSDKNPIDSWLHKLLSHTFVLFAIALMLTWAWALLLPLVPVIVIATALALAVLGKCSGLDLTRTCDRGA
jgi:hypothetical protein